MVIKMLVLMITVQVVMIELLARLVGLGHVDDVNAVVFYVNRLVNCQKRHAWGMKFQIYGNLESWLYYLQHHVQFVQIVMILK